MPAVTDFTALLSGKYWNGIEVTGRPVIVTYSFPISAPSYLSGVEGFTAATVSSFQAFTSTMQAQARSALGEWSAACGLVFLEVAPGQGDINFQLVNFNATPYGGAGIALYPFGNWNNFTYPYFSTSLDASGDVFMDTQDVSAGAVNYGTLLHEIGHAIGLKHPMELVFNGASGVYHNQVLSADDPDLTIMATVGESGGGTPTLKPLDKAAAAALYGPAGVGGVYTTSASGANSVSNWSFDAATQTVTQAGFATDDMIRGTSVADLINGLDGADTLSGLAGNDTLIGGAGNDRLFGGQGINRLVGGQDDDFYLLENPTDTVIENLNEGDDSVVVGFSYTLSVNVERLQLIDAGQVGIGNAQANTIYGNGSRSNNLNGMAGTDYILGGSLNDLLNGGTEADTMWALQGNDTYSVDHTGDFVGEYRDEGTDSVTASISYALTDNVEKLTLTGSAAINGTGNSLANTITGSAEANVLNGGDGNDSLSGGAGNDTQIGGAGNDSYLFDTDLVLGSDTLDEAGGGSDTLNFAATTTRSIALNLGLATSQLVNSNLSLTLGSAATFDIAIGGSLADTLTGNGLNNSLTGGGGNDTLNGGAGNDNYLFDTDTALGSDTLEEAGGGIDSLSFAATTTRSIALNLGLATAQVVNANLSLTLGSAATFENVIGGGLADTLTGNGLVNSLTGGGGNDTLAGGAGNDSYLFDTDVALGSDTLDEAGGGSDTLNFSATTTRSIALNLGLATSQVVNANLSLSLGSASTFESVVGGSLADTLTGNSLANRLTGGAGNDTLTGGTGADRFRFATALNATSNSDAITDFTIDHGDTIELENAVFTALPTVGTLAASAFLIGTAATDGNQRILYNNVTGVLAYDSDGNGAATAVAFATITPELALSSSQFTVT